MTEPRPLRRFDDIAHLKTAQGEILGRSDWVTVTQEMIDRFAEATGDFQWIHVDRERAQASPFGTTLAHGFLTLSLIPQMVYRIYGVDRVAAGLNYGANKIRFTAPVPCGSRLRTTLRLLRVEDKPSGAQVFTEATVELEGSDRPACVAELIVVLLPAAA
jgi:acyl dehydratase